MNDDPSEVDVLYARVQPVRSSSPSNADYSDEPVQQIADGLMKRFVDSGLAKKQVRSRQASFHAHEHSAETGEPAAAAVGSIQQASGPGEPGKSGPRVI